MAVYSFDGAFRNLNDAIGGIGEGWEKRKKLEQAATFGKQAATGDYNALAQGLFASGDIGNGLKALEVGHTRALQADAMRQAGQSFDLNSLGTGGGATLSGIGSGGNAQPQAGGQTLANLGAGSSPRYNMNGAQPQFVAAEGTSPSQRFRGPQDFITAMTPFALEVSKTTGLDPRIIIAQAAQETGWGRSAPGNNYFGIKSHGQGGGNTLATTEVINGRPTRVSDSFRAYGSMGDSVRGYGDFLTSNPRYRSMLAANGLDAQIAELGRSGYATDPQYAAKVRAIANSIQLPAGGMVTGQPQTQVAQAQTGATTPDMARAGIARVDMLLNDQGRELTPQQRQSLEDRRQKYVQIAEADVPAQGAQPAQGFTPPGQQQRQWDIPPERARAAIVELTRRMGHPGNTEGQRAMYKAQIDQLTPYADPMRSLDREGKTLANEKARRDLEGEGATPLSGDQKQQFGIPAGQAAWFTRRGELKLGPAGTTVNNTIDNKVETEEGKERAKSAAKFLGGIADTAPQIAQRNADLDMLGRVISRTPTGAGADTRAFLDRVGAGLGLSSGKLATQADAINAIVNRIAPTLRQVGSGAQSDTELRGFLSSLPSLTALPEGNQLIMSTLKRAANIERARAGVAARWQSGKLTAGEARDQIAKLDEQSIYANDQERELVSGLFGSLPQTGKAVPNGQGKPSTGWKIIGVE